jgi:hydroxymethylbilane synthase
MSSVGVFTSFLHEFLVKGEADLVVHSWKDLPIDPSPGTKVVATLPREDPRDLLLLRKDRPVLSKVLNVLTSSPRRQHNLGDFLNSAVPRTNEESREIVFRDVRGNIQTRVEKLLSSSDLLDSLKNDEPFQPHGLILAKAAVDRFLSAEEEEYHKSKDSLIRAFKECDWAVLPISVNPTAAAQGALAIEVNENRSDLIQILSEINCEQTFKACEYERATLKSHGGGCHQKIGCTLLHTGAKKDTVVVSLRGLTSEGLELSDFRILDSGNVPEFDAPKSFFCFGGKSGSSLFRREDVQLTDEVKFQAENRPLLIAKADALPHDLHPKNLVYTAGVDSWFKLASRGVWVNGCFDRMGEREPMQLDFIMRYATTPKLPSDNKEWLKLTHVDACKDPKNHLGTYKLVETNTDTDQPLIDSSVTHIYWSSGSAFEAVIRNQPELKNKIHGCGPGNTYDLLTKEPWNLQNVVLALSYEEFKSKCCNI